MDDYEATQAILDWSAIFLRLSMHDFNRHARGSGLSLAQMTVLMHLYYRGPREVMAFGDLMQVSPAGASQMVERLAQQGLVQRSETPDDRRVRLVHLTEAGRRVVDESIRARQGWVERLLASLTDEQRATIGQALRMLTEQAAALEAQSSFSKPT
jgi:MarR family 2-MHQ and catechol resistance regulon transcriptional repressor